MWTGAATVTDTTSGLVVGTATHTGGSTGTRDYLTDIIVTSSTNPSYTFRVDGITIVPEPATLTLATLGLGLVVMRRRR